MSSRRPSFMAHLLTLSMPFTMVVLIPWWLLAEYGAERGPLFTQLAGAAIFLTGLALFIATLRLFIVIGSGTLAPWRPTKHLVVVGPYRHCRNPMISGVLGMILGEAVFFTSMPLGIWAITFFSINTFYFITVEEPDLATKYGAEYRNYISRVPRWVPGLGRLFLLKK